MVGIAFGVELVEYFDVVGLAFDVGIVDIRNTLMCWESPLM